MAQEEIEIEISPSGEVVVRTKGIKGQACMDYADLFVRILGREEHREKTSEFYESAVEVRRTIDVKQRR
jgi:Protein of unknown function (DUF2997)